MSKLLSPRASARRLDDLGERSAFVDGQRIGRARRRRTREGTRLRRVAVPLVLALAVAAALGFGIHWLMTSPRFALASVEVRGAARVSPERIRDAAALVSGTNLFRVRPADVAARLEALPEIRRAVVVRELPDRVAIVVDEREPFVLALSSGGQASALDPRPGRLYWMDEGGRVLGEERRAVAPAVPLISGLSDEDVTGPRAREALGLIRTLLRSGSALGEEISEIDMSRSEGPILRTVGGVDVHLGSEDWPDRLTRLEGVLLQVAGRDPSVAVIDLRFRDQVVLRRGGEP